MRDYTGWQPNISMLTSHTFPVTCNQQPGSPDEKQVFRLSASGPQWPPLCSICGNFAFHAAGLHSAGHNNGSGVRIWHFCIVADAVMGCTEILECRQEKTETGGR